MKKYILTILGGVVLLGTILADAQTQVDNVSVSKLTEKFNASQEIKSKYQLDDASLVKREIKNAELDKYKGEPKDEIKITLGDKNLQEFTPDIELKRWNEVSFKLKPKGLESVASKDKDLKFVGDKIKFDIPKMSFEMYEVTDTEEGGYKFIWYLNEKPLTNKIEFDIESSGLDFFYQPELTPEEIAEGVIRPDNVVGSYAVYHQTKGGMNDINGKNYKTGKAFHIYRPHIIDAEGKETWGILKIENGIYSVEIPQEFLDTAVYPIKSNDTFGYTTLGGSTFLTSNTDILYLRIGTPSSNGTTDSVSFGGNNNNDGNNNFQNGIYDDFLNLLSPQTNTGSINSSTTQFFTLTFTNGPSLTGGNNYYATSFIDNPTGNDSRNAYDSGGVSGDTKYKTSLTYNTWPDPLLSPTNSANKYSIYATYTPAGGEETATSSATASFLGNINFLGNIQIK